MKRRNNNLQLRKEIRKYIILIERKLIKKSSSQ